MDHDPECGLPATPAMVTTWLRQARAALPAPNTPLTAPRLSLTPVAPQFQRARGSACVGRTVEQHRCQTRSCRPVIGEAASCLLAPGGPARGQTRRESDDRSAGKLAP